MSKREEAIWKAFQFDSPDGLGLGPIFSEYDEVTIQWDQRTKHDSPVRGMIKIDGIVKSDTAIWICEVKETLNYKSLGQALSYTATYREKKEPTKPVRPCIVFANFAGKSVGVVEAIEEQEDMAAYLVEDIPKKLAQI